MPVIPHLTLMHPPSRIDFRNHPFLYGPISDGIPSTPIFEMYPIGFITLANYLERFGYDTRIVTLGMRMLVDHTLELEKFFQSLKAKAFGIDLHWLPHVQGSLECARLLKKYHPEIPVIMGGLSATYFHDELIKYPHVDYVLRGDCTEEPALKLLRVLNYGGSLAEVPNLTWKNHHGEVIINPFSYYPENLDYINIDYRNVLRDAVKYRDPVGYMPYHNWISYPGAAVLTCRGCVNSCIICGGSAFSGHINCSRRTPVYRSNKLIVDDILKIQGVIKSPIFVFGDLTQQGEGNALEFFELIRPFRLKNELIIEFFSPPSRELLKAALTAVPNLSIEISPETHDDESRQVLGKPFNNRELEEMIDNALQLGCRRIDLFFMVGLSQQTSESVQETVRYVSYLLERFGKDRQIFPYVDPLAPFIDPGSNVHENPAAYGYKLSACKLEDYRQKMQTPSWKYMLNYETDWMDRHQIVDATYRAALGFNQLKRKYEIISAKEACQIDNRINLELKQIDLIDRIWAKAGGEFRASDYQDLGINWKESLYNKVTCTNDELERPVWLFRYIPLPKFIRQLLLRIFKFPYGVKSFVRSLKGYTKVS